MFGWICSLLSTSKDWCSRHLSFHLPQLLYEPWGVMRCIRDERLHGCNWIQCFSCPLIPRLMTKTSDRSCSHQYSPHFLWKLCSFICQQGWINLMAPASLQWMAAPENSIVIKAMSDNDKGGTKSSTISDHIAIIPTNSVWLFFHVGFWITWDRPTAGIVAMNTSSTSDPTMRGRSCPEPYVWRTSLPTKK